jgi:hypothetical protein
MHGDERTHVVVCWIRSHRWRTEYIGIIYGSVACTCQVRLATPKPIDQQ